MEKDWKHFSTQAPIWRERFLAARNAELAKQLVDAARTPTECFWDVEEQIRKNARTLRDCLDGHSRSRMIEYLLRMLAQNMITADDLGGFSPELQERLKIVL